MDSNRKYLTNKWSHLKQQIKDRQLLAYIVKIPLEELNSYIYGTPSNEEILRIEKLIAKDRREKTARIRKELQNIVGYREAVQFATKAGTNSTTIREIISGKKDAVGYDTIDKLELYLNAVTGFELSFENSLKPKEFLKEEVDKILDKICSISENLIRQIPSIRKVTSTGKYEIRTNYYSNTIEFESVSPTERLIRENSNLEEAINQLNILFETYIKE